MVALLLVALLFVGPISNSTSGSSQGATPCSNVPSGDNVAIDWITFEMYMLRSTGTSVAAPVVVAFADAVTDRGSDILTRRKIELQSPELLMGAVPTAFFADKKAILHAKAIMGSGDRLLVWGWPGFPQSEVVGNLVVVSGDGAVTFVGDCIPRFDSAFAVFAASRGTSEAAVDVLVRILTDPTGETATRFRASAGMTRAGP